MKRDLELRYLLSVLLIISLGFLVLYSSYWDRGISTSLITVKGTLDISDYSIAFFPNALYASFLVGLFLLAHFYLRVKLPDADPFILPAVAILSGIGIILALRLSPDLAASRNEAIKAILSRNPDDHIKDNVLSIAQFGMKQFISAGMGMLLMLLSMNAFNGRGFSWLSSKRYLWVFLSAALIIATLLVGTRINGKSLWLFGFQTVELVKLLMLFFIAGYIYEKGKGIEAYRHMGFNAWLNYAGPFVVMWFFALAPIFIQGDLGPTFLIFMVFLIMFYYSGNRNLMTAAFILLIVAVGYISYKTGYPSIVRTRFDMLLDPFGKSESMSRVLWSISSGGFWGTGIGYGQPHSIPEVQSDFSFAALCEEVGFVGGAAVILAYALLIQRCFEVASKTSNLYKKTLVIGIAALFGIQAFIIVSGNLSYIPMTGITLPFVSYGGSSMIISFLMIGIVLKISGEELR